MQATGPGFQPPKRNGPWDQLLFANVIKLQLAQKKKTDLGTRDQLPFTGSSSIERPIQRAFSPHRPGSQAKPGILLTCDSEA